MKILAKIARRHDGEELPDRRELVEMDLFDTDRNPWPGDISGDIWKRYDYDVATPFRVPVYPATFPAADEFIATEDLVVEKLSLVIAFIGGMFNALSGMESGGTGQSTLARIDVGDTSSDNYVQAYTGSHWISNDDGIPLNFDAGPAYAWGVLHPGTYPVKVFCYATHTPIPAVVDMVTFAATVALLPVGELPAGWDVTGG